MPVTGSRFCTEPLPKLRWPTSSARPWSCSAPETISEAEALKRLISTTTGMSAGLKNGFLLFGFAIYLFS